MAVFTASDGAQIAYEDEGSGTPLVFLHGLMAHGGFFQPQRELADRFRVIRIDLRGHGRSRTPGERPRVEELAADVSALAEELGLEQAIGIGWSLGASVLWHVLIGRAAPRFAGAVVVDMTARVLNDQLWELGLSSEACEARSDAIALDFEAFAIGAGQGIFAQPVEDGRRELAQWAAHEFAQNDPDAIGSLWSSLMLQDFRRLLKRIGHPTLVVHGARSTLYGADTANHLADALPNARIAAFQESGHAPHLEEPELFNRTISDFAASCRWSPNRNEKI